MDETLENLGYEVLRITEDTPDLWNEVDAVLVGIRAFNTEKWLMNSGDRIKTFVEGGGNFVVTYTTSGRSGIELPTPHSVDRWKRQGDRRRCANYHDESLSSSKAQQDITFRF